MYSLAFMTEMDAEDDKTLCDYGEIKFCENGWTKKSEDMEKSEKY